MALRLQDEPSWKAFLQEAGIPDAEATAYTKIFLDNRVTERNISDLTAEHLKVLGITILGDILSILKHAKEKTATAPVEQIKA